MDPFSGTKSHVSADAVFVGDAFAAEAFDDAFADFTFAAEVDDVGATRNAIKAAERVIALMDRAPKGVSQFIR